jgi:hypothetical protein
MDKPTRSVRSFWLDQVLGDDPNAPQLKGSRWADVAILGGYAGLRNLPHYRAIQPLVISIMKTSGGQTSQVHVLRT